MFRVLLICCSIFLTQVHSLGHAQSAYLRSNQIFAGDIAELIIEFDNKIPTLYALDTSVLEQDFEVLDKHSSISRVLDSSKASHRMQWNIQILPRRIGNLRIPSLLVGDTNTPVLTLEVVPQTPELSSTSNVYIELEAQPENPYVGQQIQIVIRVIHNIPLFDDDLLDLKIANADTYRAGPESIYSIFRDGNEFQVLERNLSVIARSPGEIRIPPAIYRGLIKSDGSSSATDSMTQSRRINRNSKALHLQVRNPPPGFGGNNWLPARQLEINQHWDEIIDELHVGDSLGFTLSIEAKGLPAEALPADLLSIDSGKVRVYADQETRSNRFDGRELVGRLEQRFVVVVTEPGEIQLPAMNLKWWDVEQEAERIATLAGKTWNVLTPETGEAGIDTAETTTSWYGTGSHGLAITLPRSNWPWYTVIGAILLIPGLLVCIKSVRARMSESVAARLASRRNRQLLRQACTSNNPVLAFKALIEWGRARWPHDNINSLYQIRIKSSGLAGELRRLDRALYADHGETWRGQPLWGLVAAEHRHLTAETTTQEDSLPDLYPQRS